MALPVFWLDIKDDVGVIILVENVSKTKVIKKSLWSRLFV